MKNNVHNPGDRTPLDELTEKYRNISQLPYFKETIEALPYIVAILNHNRQFIYSNEALVNILGLESVEELIGLKAGEAFHCIHAGGNCGTSAACGLCGILQAAEECMRRKERIVSEARIRSLLNNKETAYDFQITATPYFVDEEFFIIISMVDISDKKRKSALEHIFFHDILNTAGGLQGLIELLKSGVKPEDVTRLIDTLEKTSKALTENIISQRELIKAENGELSVTLFPVNSYDIIEDVYHQMSSHGSCKGKQLLKTQVDHVPLITDETLLARVLINMVKNALEASLENQTVTLGCTLVNERIVFQVHNQSYMEKEVQLQVFSRSFSTKSRDRGLGTYSMKLISEQYLDGEISFTSSPDAGTTFYASFPVHHRAAKEMHF